MNERSALEPVYFPLHLFPPPYRKIWRSDGPSSGVSAGLIPLVAVLIVLLSSTCAQASEQKSLKTRWTNQWAVRIDGDNSVANQLAAKHGYRNIRQVLPGFYLFSHLRLSKRLTRSKRSAQFTLSREPKVKWLEQQRGKKRVKRDRLPLQHYPVPNDPKWSEMWYLNRGGGLDMNVQEVWRQGITGKNIVVTILDDGLEYSHPDLRQNYEPRASYDINDDDADPSPRYDPTNDNRHGTRCAGEVAAVFNNSVCATGIAYNARIGGIRMLDGLVTDAVEASALSHSVEYVDIYSASWGPDDDGRTVDGPARLAQTAFREGILKGRTGKGSIFIWASGNGGREGDSCNCDGYTNSIHTLSISSATENGNVPWYSEACSSSLASTYSSGGHHEKNIVTTDLYGGCTENHTGTSASAPIAAGLCALTLEANRNLTWRDMQHIVVRAARPANLKAPDWTVNGAGRKVSHYFGFGLMDAAMMVRLARSWKTVPPQHKCVTHYSERYRSIPPQKKLQVSLESDGCEKDLPNQVTYVEHVQARLTLQAPKRGDIEIFLISPSGTKSTLLAKRTKDQSRAGFREWAFMTSHCWGESAVGKWVLEVQNDGWSAAHLLKWDLILYGTDQPVGNTGSFELRSINDNLLRNPGGVVKSNGSAAKVSVGSNVLLVALIWPFSAFLNLRSVVR